MSVSRVLWQDDVAIRRFNLAVERQELERLKRFLSTEERSRAARLIAPQLRDRFIAGRGYLRETLAHFLEQQPSTLELHTEVYGKPRLAARQGSPALRFNVSHSGDLLLIALSQEGEIGVDLELVRPELDFAPIARRYFAERECGELFGLPNHEQRTAFYRCWVRKEAYLKGVGMGFNLSPREFAVSLLPGEPPRLRDREDGETSRWELRDVEVPAGYLSALAVKRK